jgi:hypothetical protein
MREHVLAYFCTLFVQRTGIDAELVGEVLEGRREGKPAPVRTIADAVDAHCSLCVAVDPDQPHSPAVEACVESVPRPRSVSNGRRVDLLGVVLVELLAGRDACPVAGELGGLELSLLLWGDGLVHPIRFEGAPAVLLIARHS